MPLTLVSLKGTPTQLARLALVAGFSLFGIPPCMRGLAGLLLLPCCRGPTGLLRLFRLLCLLCWRGLPCLLRLLCLLRQDGPPPAPTFTPQSLPALFDWPLAALWPVLDCAPALALGRAFSPAHAHHFPSVARAL